MSQKFKVKLAAGPEKPENLKEATETAKATGVLFFPEEVAALRVRAVKIEAVHEK